MSVYTGKRIKFTHNGDDYILDANNILSYEDEDHFPAAGVTGKLYIAVDTNIIYRWDDTNNEYIQISSAGGNGTGLVRVAFSLATSDWTLSNDVYQGAVMYNEISSISEEIISYDANIASNLTSDIFEVEKDSSNHTLIFKTASLPSGTISGNILIFTADLSFVNMIPISEKGSANGVATLDNSGKVPSNQLPSYKQEISILFIGNSLTQDGIAYLPYVLKTYYPNVNFRFYMWYIAGKTLAQQYEYFTGDSVADIFSVAENSETWTNYTSSKTMSQVLSTYNFNIVCMQEFFNTRTSFAETDLAGWNNCQNYIVSNYTGGNPLKFVSLFHAPDRSNAGFIFDLTKHGCELILQKTLCQDLIPIGISIYRALSTELNSLGDQGGLSPDGVHAQEGLPCLLQTFTVVCWLFDKISIEMSIYGSSCRMTTAIYNSLNVPGPNLGTGVITGTDAQNLLAQKIAIQAYKEGKAMVDDSFSNATAMILKSKTFGGTANESGFIQIPGLNTADHLVVCVNSPGLMIGSAFNGNDGYWYYSAIGPVNGQRERNWNFFNPTIAYYYDINSLKRVSVSGMTTNANGFFQIPGLNTTDHLVIGGNVAGLMIGTAFNGNDGYWYYEAINPVTGEHPINYTVNSPSTIFYIDL